MEIKLNLKRNFKLVNEGERVLEITSAKATPSGAPNKLTLQMKDVEDGATLQSIYNFNNDTSVWAMGMMLNKALDIEDGGSFDTRDVDKLVGIKLLCEVAHSTSNDRQFANVKKVIERVEDNNTSQSTNVEETVYPDMSLLNGRQKIVVDDLD